MQQHPTTPRKVRGRPFRRGHDPRRHVFTPQECSEGFYAALASIATRNPNATPYGALEFFMQRRQSARRGA
jgi:hypothetical protein